MHQFRGYRIYSNSSSSVHIESIGMSVPIYGSIKVVIAGESWVVVSLVVRFLCARRIRGSRKLSINRVSMSEETLWARPFALKKK